MIFLKSQKGIVGLAVFVLAGFIGYMMSGLGSAATYVAESEAEAGVLAGKAVKVTDDTAASGAGFVRFGKSTATPELTPEVLVTGKDHIWDVVQLPTGELLFNERSGKISLYRNGQVVAVATVSDVKQFNLGGMMGMAIDPQFETNGLVYSCMNSTAGDIRIVRWKLADDTLTERKDIITGIPANEKNIHSGCQLGFGADGNLWVGTGDAHIPDSSQMPNSLAGKVLRVTRDGAGVPGNQGGAFDARIFNFGHRNPQGLAFFDVQKNGVYGLSVEHGADDNDEVNELRTGNFGWAPSKVPYSEDGVSMTDLKRFPNAILPIWASGVPTQAPSGATIVYGDKWKGWDGAVIIAVLKDQHLKILRLDESNQVVKEEKVLQGTYGRLRTASQGVDGNLYITTDNGTTDKIIKLTPR